MSTPRNRSVRALRAARSRFRGDPKSANRRRAIYLTVLVVTLLIAGVASAYASGHPDGLEYVAEQTGFLDSAEDSPTAGSPFADYGNAGGVVGAVLVLVLMTGLAYLLRRRPQPAED